MNRGRFLLLFGTAVIVLLSLRILHLSVFLGEQLRQQADENRFFRKVFFPPRGVVFDRGGIPLVQNSVLYAQIVGDPLVAHPRISPIDEHKALDLLVSQPEMVEKLYQRFYTFGSDTSHVLGYVGFPALHDSGEYFSEKIGKDGLERYLEKELRGSYGIEEYEINAHGSIQRLVRVIDAKPGKDTTISIDSSLTQKAAELMRGRTGAVVVSDISTAQVLVLVSSPAYDPMNISPSLGDPGKPLLNRALQAYPPGSVFKMITALAALKKGSIDDDTLIKDEGEVRVGDQVYRNWYFSAYGKTEGDINVTKALARSNDVFFYKVAEKVGPESIAELSSLFHLGKRTGLELRGERAGLVPLPSWKEKTVGEKWYLGDTYHMGIGQGYVLTTPLQINAMTAALARRGVWCRPTLMMSERECEELSIPKKDLETVIMGMMDACSSGGTGVPFFGYNGTVEQALRVACKTGTAEQGARDEKGNRPTHAWFTMFYPAQSPEVAITVLLESTSEQKFLEGSSDAAPIAKAIWDAWVSSQR